MRISDFDLYQDLLIRESGLALSPDKSYLLDSRLTPVARKWGYVSLEAMTMALRGVPEPALLKDVVEAMATGETSFFRDGKLFESFKNIVLPYFARTRAKKRALKLWCAAGSSGQEPYSLAIAIRENASLFPGWDIEILATDISDEIIGKARAAEYTQFEAQRGLPVELLLKYFEQSGENWKVKDEVRNLVKFQNFNLLHPMDALGPFDIILCRNVLTYFDEPTREKVLSNIARRLTDDGFLFLGAAETVPDAISDFRPVESCRGLYTLREGDYDMKELAEAAAR